MSFETSTQTITQQSAIKTTLRLLREGDEIHINGMSTPFRVISDSENDSGEETSIVFKVLDKRYQITLEGPKPQKLHLKDMEGNNDLAILTVEHAGGGEFIISDTRAADYLSDIR